MHAELLFTDWSFEPTVSLGLIAAVAAYVAAIRLGRIRADDDVSAWFRSPHLRPLCFALGIAAAVVALQSPLDEAGDSFLFWMHMIQHLLLMMVTPPLVLLGVAGMRSPRPGALRRLRAVWATLTMPWTACVVFNAVVAVWHVPALYQATLTTLPLHIVEHVTFVGAGFILWWPVIDPMRRGKRAVSGMTKIAMLVVAGVPPTILGFAFVSAPAALYRFYTVAPRLWGFTPLSDQQLAGVIMLGLGNIIYFIAIAIIFVRLFEDPAEDEARALRGAV